MSQNAFDVTFNTAGITTRSGLIPFDHIRKIRWSNIRVSGAVIPRYQTLIIAISHGRLVPSVLMHRIPLRRAAVSKTIPETFRTGFRVPDAVEAEISVAQRRMVLTLDLLHAGTGIVPLRKGYWFELWAETLGLIQQH